ncbi:DUF4864 domain-containing protein [Primorskyibacter sp. S87]|uniref:DUF4864 domain-containing protein n=1 Tax=Primorskyibacter sp. S87 TaxID=3415126 RepID=UPI003C7C7075
MRHYIFGLCIWLALSVSAAAQNSEIESKINGQIEAFQRDDFNAAFSYASPGIQGIFGTAERFGQMVRNGYPMVWRPSEIRFLELREIAGSLWQKVMITDSTGRVHLLDYQMLDLDNEWKINAVHLLPPQDEAA